MDKGYFVMINSVKIEEENIKNTRKKVKEMFGHMKNLV